MTVQKREGWAERKGHWKARQAMAAAVKRPYTTKAGRRPIKSEKRPKSSMPVNCPTCDVAIHRKLLAIDWCMCLCKKVGSHV